jgi:hypothetical protein
MEFRAFLGAFTADWVTLMSGIASVILLILGTFRKWNNVPRPVFWIAAALCFFFASARVWTTEHYKVQSQITYIQLDLTGTKPGEAPSRKPLFQSARQSVINIGICNTGLYRADDEYNPVSLVIHDINPLYDPRFTIAKASSPEIENEVFAEFTKHVAHARFPRVVFVPNQPCATTQASTDHALSEFEIEQLQSAKKLMYVVGFTKWTALEHTNSDCVP